MKAKRIKGRRAAAGCVNTAFAQILAYHKSPQVFRGFRLFWDELTDLSLTETASFRYDVAVLFRRLGDATNTKWGLPEEGGSSANITSIPKVLREEMGYRNSGDLIQYDESMALSEVTRFARPVVMAGTTEAGKPGHAWVIDGVGSQSRDKFWISVNTGEILDKSKDVRFLLHCNWGWDGRLDGYFLSDVFDPFDPVARSLRSDSPSAYDYNLWMIKGIKP